MTLILQVLSTIEICISGFIVFSLIERISGSPRTGIAVRIDRYNLNLPKQSLADHIKMLSVLADAFKLALSAKVDSEPLAKMVAFHDLSEAIIGDVPDFTDKDLATTHHKTPEEKNVQEKAANDLIADRLTGSLRTAFVNTIKLLEDEELFETKFFTMLDKSEPIISIWRYIHLFHNNIDIEQFLDAMTDFFTNPTVARVGIAEDAVKLTNFLQNKELARRYYHEGPAMLADLQPNVFVPDVLQKLFSIKLECV